MGDGFFWKEKAGNTTQRSSHNKNPERQKKGPNQTKVDTPLLKFNIASQKWCLEDYFPFGAQYIFRGELLNFQGVLQEQEEQNSDSQTPTTSNKQLSVSQQKIGV